MWHQAQARRCRHRANRIEKTGEGGGVTRMMMITNQSREVVLSTGFDQPSETLKKKKKNFHARTKVPSRIVVKTSVTVHDTTSSQRIPNQFFCPSWVGRAWPSDMP
jgi:hypothetical protein